MPSQLQLPCLTHEVDAKAVMLLFRHAAEAGALVDAARGDQDALGPQRHLVVAFLTGGADAMIDQRTADADPASLFLRQHRADLALRTLVQPGEGLAALGGEAEANLPPVRGKGLSADQAFLVEILHDAAEIAGIEAKLDADLLCCEAVAMGQLVQDPRL